MFEQLNRSGLIPELLLTLSAMMMFCFLAIVMNRLVSHRKANNDQWRDPPPLIYKLFKPLVKVFSADIKSNMSAKQYASLQMKLSSAGLYYSLLPEEFVTLRYLCLTICAGVLVWVYWLFAPLKLAVMAVLLIVLFIGFAYPDIWLNDRVKARKNRVDQEFPFLLDLLILSMRAGLNYTNALSQSISSLKVGPVKEDFGRLQRELKAGKHRSQALLELADRMDSPAIYNFVSALNQAEVTGGEIVDVLHAQAMQRRTQRFQRAEEKAGQAPVKMLMPMMLFLFPLIFMMVAFVILVSLADSNMLSPALMRMLGY